jgi:hypothetical protein
MGCRKKKPTSAEETVEAKMKKKNSIINKNDGSSSLSSALSSLDFLDLFS